MMRKGGQFFDFVKSITGASVTIDSMTGDHLRIDGRGGLTTAATNPINLVDGDASGTGGVHSIANTVHGTNNNNGTNSNSNSNIDANQLYGRELPSNMSEGERAALAEELVKLQIELYRDHCIRQHDWIFGRDWTLARRIFAQNNNAHFGSGNNDNVASNNGASGNSTSGAAGNDGSLSPMGRSGGVGSSLRTSSAPLDDPRTLTNACLEIAEIVSALGLDGTIAAHASVILYRSITVGLQQRNQMSDSQLKIREALLACVFIANKAQKVTKWKRLDTVLEAAYKTFYPEPTSEQYSFLVCPSPAPQN